MLGAIVERAVRTLTQTLIAVLVTLGLGLGSLPLIVLAFTIAFIAALLSIVTSVCAVRIGGEPAITESPSAKE